VDAHHVELVRIYHRRIGELERSIAALRRGELRQTLKGEDVSLQTADRFAEMIEELRRGIAIVETPA
jgi:hypothetical protein